MQESREHPPARDADTATGPDTATDASAGTAAPHAGSDDDTLDLPLAGELAALLAEHGAHEEHFGNGTHHGHPGDPDRRGDPEGAESRVPDLAAPGPSAPSAVGLLPVTLSATVPAEAPPHLPHPPQGPGHLPDPDLLDHLAEWPAAHTPAGVLQLVPVRLSRDLRLLTAWMNDPAVDAFWELAGPEEITAAHVRAQLEGDGRSVPCLGVLDGTPMSYWELYRADLDPLARYCGTRPHDTGVRLLLGGVADRGRGLGRTLLRAASELVLDQRPRCERVLAEPDLRNTPLIAALLGAGFRFAAELDLPDRRAALLVRDRELRAAL